MKEKDILKNLNDAESAFGHYETKIMKLKNLLEITKIISSTLEEDKLAQIILYSCQGQFLVQNASLLLLEDVDKLIYRDKISIGLEKDHFNISFNRDSQLIQLFLKSTDEAGNLKTFGKKSYFFESIKVFLDDPIEEGKVHQLNPEVVCPLWGKSTLYGFLFLGKKLDSTTFAKEELGYIYQFAELAAISIENAKLFEMAIIDRMTKLYNHQYFKNRLYDEIERSKRYKNPLSLMFFDIDHFKNFNDTYGHQQGDIVLKEVARIIQETVRRSDVPARYGGEEFAVILPETALEQAQVVGEKIRTKIEKYPFPGQKDPLHVSISCGIARFPSDTNTCNIVSCDITTTDFVEMADQALYYSKRNGRNQVSIFTEELKAKVAEAENKENLKKNKEKPH